MNRMKRAEELLRDYLQHSDEEFAKEFRKHCPDSELLKPKKEDKSNDN